MKQILSKNNKEKTMISSSFNSYTSASFDAVNIQNLQQTQNNQNIKNSSEQTDSKPTEPYVNASFPSDFNSGNFIAFKISQQLNSNNSPLTSLQLNLSGYGIGG
jgi:hypothetical protein